MNRKMLFVLFAVIILTSCSINNDNAERERIDFNFNWKFNLGEIKEAKNIDLNDSSWETIRLPHDWSVTQSYTKINTSSSTGFLPGGIGWYRKSFTLPRQDSNKVIWIEFDGIYNNSTVWLNGQLLGTRPYGYSSFSYELSEHLNYGEKPNVISVRVDRSAYAESRWYTGSGIYRNVRLVKTSQLHIAKWGVKITTPKVSKQMAELIVETSLTNKSGSKKNIELEVSIIDNSNSVIESISKEIEVSGEIVTKSEILINYPKLWNLESPNMYRAVVKIIEDGKIIDNVTTNFGIRSIKFDADKGFFLNGKSIKIKGVNIHHDAGSVGAAVPKEIWRSRLEKLKSVGTNAIRTAHNPHSPELLELCDEMGLLVQNEIFDEWDRPKRKNIAFLGDGRGKGDVAKSYTEHFNEWAERDLKDFVKRDFNHPSVIMWSIGNEIEWTFPNYGDAYEAINGNRQFHKGNANYDPSENKAVLEMVNKGADTLDIIARKLTKWFKEVDTTRAVTYGGVFPSLGLALEYANELDVYGFNYRPNEYDAANKAYPNLKIIGSETLGNWNAWKAAIERDFVSGIFIWTGFAYMGEAGPWPRKGLNMALFDFAGFKTARGHFFETIWKEKPKVYMVTTPASESEYSFDENNGWKFTLRDYPIEQMSWLNRWDWDIVYDKWNYQKDENIIVQVYTNCEEVELFVNSKSIGKKLLSDFNDRIIKWQIPYETGELKVVAYNDGIVKDEYILNSPGEMTALLLTANKQKLKADNYDVIQIEATLLDDNGTIITDIDKRITFNVDGDVTILGVDNGSEYNVQDSKADNIITHNGKAIIIIQAGSKAGMLNISASTKELKSNEVIIQLLD